MLLPNAYSLKPSAIPRFFQAISQASIPEKFDAAFLARLGFRFAIDRSFVDILHELQFISPDGRPTKRYAAFHAGKAAKESLTMGIADAYRDLFTLQNDACALRADELFEKLKLLYSGSKSDIMITGIAKTFQALCQYAAGLDKETPAKAVPAGGSPPRPVVTEGNTPLPQANPPGPRPETAAPAPPVPHGPEASAVSEDFEGSAPLSGPAGPAAAPPDGSEAAATASIKDAADSGLADAPQDSRVLDLDDPLEDQALHEELALLGDEHPADGPSGCLAPGSATPAPAATPRLDAMAAALAASGLPQAVAAPEDRPWERDDEGVILLTDLIEEPDVPDGQVLNLSEPEFALETPGPSVSPGPTKLAVATDGPEAALAGETLLAFINDLKTRTTHYAAVPEAVAGIGNSAKESGGAPRQPLQVSGGTRSEPVGPFGRVMLVLPESRDPKVYDAIFASLKNNLF